MLNRKHSSLLPLITAVVSGFLPTAAFASVGAGAGLPYEDTFSKIVTSLTGPWAWTVAIVCVILFCWRAVERGGDLGGSTMGFLGPAFICTLLLGAKKLMTFFGQGALIESVAQLELWAAFVGGLLIGTQPAFAIGIALSVRDRRRQRQQRQQDATLCDATFKTGDVGHTFAFDPTSSGTTLAAVETQEVVDTDAARSGVYQRPPRARRPARLLVPSKPPTVSG
jgi:type IV secretory pathway VirB2 component (pilin)